MGDTATVGSLETALRRAQAGNANCGPGTMIVIELPGGQCYAAESLSYEEDLAGALVITAGRITPAGAGACEAGSRLHDDLARAVCDAIAAGLTPDQVAATLDGVAAEVAG